MFTPWLLEQSDREDGVGRLARLAYLDINAGCASAYSNATNWLYHFKDNHAKQLPLFTELLGDAYVEYCTELDKHKSAF